MDILMTHHEHAENNERHILLGYDNVTKTYFTGYKFDCVGTYWANGHYHLEQIEAIQDYLKRIQAPFGILPTDETN